MKDITPHSSTPVAALTDLELEDEINRLRQQKNAVILAHYYQEPELQEIADFVGDSLDLSRKAAATDADIIVFCGVRFMAETAKILNPEKTVLVPDMEAGCSLEASCPAKEFGEFRKKHPEHLSLTYINCSAAVKAQTDIIVTSSNAEAIIRQIPEDQPILFAPDKYLGGYLAKKTGRDMTLWQGTCIVHEQFSEKELIKLKTRYPLAHIIAHPECPEHLLNHAEHVGSTSSLLKYTQDKQGAEFIVLTELGILHQMKKLSPSSTFYDVPGINDGACVSCNSCPYMKLNTMEKLHACLRDETPELVLDMPTIEAARKPLEKMLEMSANIPSSAIIKD